MGSKAKRNRQDANDRRANSPAGQLKAAVRQVSTTIETTIPPPPLSDGPKADPATWGGNPKPKKKKRRR